MRRARWVAWALCAWLLAASALAQETGGSFGGGDWDEPAQHHTPRGGGGGGGGAPRPPSTPPPLHFPEPPRPPSTTRESESWAPRSYGADAPRDPELAPRSRRSGWSSLVCVIIGLAFLAVPLLPLAGGAHRLFGARSRGLAGPQSPLWNGVDIVQLQLAIDWRARAQVQRELEAMARSGRTASKEGRAALLHATSRLLRAVELSWLYAGGTSFTPMSPPQAHGVFKNLAQHARAKFRIETVRAEGAAVRDASADARAKEHEGPGVVLVTLIVASRRDIAAFDPSRAAEIRRLLDSLERVTAENLVALEVIWSPAVETDRMSTAELEALYPELTRLGDIGGRVFCGYCSGPYPMELAHCPHCGAPRAS